MNDNLFNLGTNMPDPRNYETIKCDKCGSIQFVNQCILKKVSGMELGRGAQYVTVPFSIFTCAKCGTILPEDIKMYKLEDDLGLPNENKDEEVKQEETKMDSILIV